MEIFCTIGYFQKIHFPKNLTISPYFLFIENKWKKEKNLIYYKNFKDYLELSISVSNIPAKGKILSCIVRKKLPRVFPAIFFFGLWVAYTLLQFFQPPLAEFSGYTPGTKNRILFCELTLQHQCLACDLMRWLCAQGVLYFRSFLICHTSCSLVRYQLSLHHPPGIESNGMQCWWNKTF